MDPNANVERLIEMLAAYHAGAYRDSEAAQNLGEVMTYLGDLDDWLRKGGFLPTRWAPATEHLYEKCDHCHLFVEPSDPRDVADGCAPYQHLHRGNDADEALAAHEPEPSGRKANLLTWRTYGPLAMRERFTS